MSRLSCLFSSYVIGLASSSSSLSNGNIGAKADDVLGRRADLLVVRRDDAEPLARLCAGVFVCEAGVPANADGGGGSGG